MPKLVCQVTSEGGNQFGDVTGNVPVSRSSFKRE